MTEPEFAPGARPDNAGVLRYLGSDQAASQVPVERPPDDVDTWRLGAHPDIVEHLWTRLNSALPSDGRFLVADTVALVDPDSGLVIAVALGTQYALRLTGAGLAAAEAADFETAHEFRTVGRILDLGATFGPGWFFGRYDEGEGEWLAETVAAANL